MNQDIKTLVLRLSIGILCISAGIVFRPFWLSEWGVPTFILLVWVVTSIAMGWGGKGKPYSLGFGIIVGSGVASSLIVIALTKSVYVGGALLIALTYIGMKTKFFARRWGEESGPQQKQ